jgi:hypothetical protein
VKKTLLTLTLLTTFSAMAYTTSYTKGFYVAGDSCVQIQKMLKHYMPRVKSYYQKKGQVITEMQISVCENLENGQQQMLSQIGDVNPGINIDKNEVIILNKDKSQKLSIEGKLLVQDI